MQKSTQVDQSKKNLFTCVLAIYFSSFYLPTQLNGDISNKIPSE
jgi:hypothetical protein